jgi:hypothetical protein
MKINPALRALKIYKEIYNLYKSRSFQHIVSFHIPEGHAAPNFTAIINVAAVKYPLVNNFALYNLNGNIKPSPNRKASLIGLYLHPTLMEVVGVWQY